MTGLTRFDLDAAVEAERTLNELRRANRDGVPGEVFTRLKGLPVMLRTNGVPATLAFFAAKADQTKPVGKAYAQVSTALHRHLSASLGERTEAAPTDLYARLRDQTDTAVLLRAFARLEAYAGWLRRLAEALEIRQEAETASTATAVAAQPVPPEGQNESGAEGG